MISKTTTALSTTVDSNLDTLLDQLGMSGAEHRSYYDPETGWLIQANHRGTSYIVECVEKQGLIHIYK